MDFTVYEAKGYDINFVANNQIVHLNSQTLDSSKAERLFNEFGLRVFRDRGAVCLYDPKFWSVNRFNLRYIGKSQKPPQPINLRRFDRLFGSFDGDCLDLTDWDFSRVLSVSEMVSYSSVVTVDLHGVKFSQSCDFSKMFYNCFELENVFLTGCKFYAPLNFVNCNKLFGRFCTKDSEQICKSLLYNEKLDKDKWVVAFKEGQKDLCLAKLLGYTAQAKAKNGLVVCANPRLMDSKRTEEFYEETGYKVFVEQNGECRTVLYDPSEWKVAQDHLKYVGKSAKPTQPVGVSKTSYLFESWDGEELDLSHWDFSEIFDISNTVTSCYNLRKFVMRDTIISVKSAANFVKNCSNLESINLDGVKLKVSRLKFTTSSYFLTNLPNLRELLLSGWSVKNPLLSTGLRRLGSQYLKLNSERDIEKVINKSDQLRILNSSIATMDFGWR